MKRYSLLLGLALLACGTDEPIPQEKLSISIPEILLVDESGATFQATVTGAATEEVLEYGFVWSQNSRQTIETDPKVSMTGTPPPTFNLRAEKDLRTNQAYEVSSFIRTPAQVIYSEPVSFISKGSQTLILLGVEAAERVYFGDTVRVLVDNLRREDQLKMKLEFEFKETPFFNYTTEGFSFTIPGDFHAYSENVGRDLFRLKVIIDQETFNFNLPLKFQKPQFDEPRVVRYAEQWSIKGDYLYPQTLSISYVSDGETIALPITAAAKNEISFAPTAFFKEKNPVLLVNIRDEVFEVNQIIIEDSDIEPGQTLSAEEGTYLYRVKVDNLNFFRPTLPSNPPLLLLEPAGFKAQIISNESDRMSFTVYADAPVSGRNFRVYANNFGQNSANFATGEYALPALPRFDLPSGLREHFNVPGQAIGSKAFFLNKGKIYEFSSGQFAQVSSVNLPDQEEALFERVQDKLYFTSFAREGTATGMPFYSFDPVSGQSSRKSDFPRQGGIVGSFVWQDEIYVYLRALVQGESKIVTMKYQVSSDTWTEEIEENPPFQNYFNSFEYAGKLMAFSADRGGLIEWDEVQKSWRTLESVSSFNMYHKFSVEVVGDMAYFHIPNNGLFAYDLRRRGLENRVNSDLFHSQSLVKVNGKMIILGAVNRFFLYEIDQEYF
ncbi:hypothetical protein [Algoriphagus namhaensis]